MNIKKIAFVTLVSLIMTSGIASQASVCGKGNHTGNPHCTAVSPGSDPGMTLMNTYTNTTGMKTNVNTGIDLNTGVYNTNNVNNDSYSGSSSNSTGIGYGGYSNSGSYSDANSNAQGGNGYGGTGIGGSSVSGSGVYGSGNSANDIRNNNKATGGEGGSSNATAYGGEQTQGQLQGQTATTGNQSSNNSTTVNTGNTEVANKTITHRKKGYDLPPAAPAIAPTVIGQMGTSSTTAAVSTPFGGFSIGGSRTTKEGKRLLDAQAEAVRVQTEAQEAMIESQITAQDIRNLKDAEELSPEDRAVVREFILNKYRN